MAGAFWGFWHAQPAKQPSQQKRTWPVASTKCWSCGRFGKRKYGSRTYECARCGTEWVVPPEDDIKPDAAPSTEEST